MSPFFSICIPNFNYAKYIGETIRSVLAQDDQDFEIVVSDNASTDDSVAVVEQLAAESGKIRLFRNRRNIGFAPNLERAARPALGRYMLMLSSDDIMLPGALSAYRRVLAALGPRAARAVIASTTSVIDAAGTVTGRLGLEARYPLERFDAGPDLPCASIDGLKMLALTLPAHDGPLPFLATLYSRALYEAVEGYAGTYNVGPDYHFLVKLLTQDPIVVRIDRDYFGYRVHQANQLAQTTLSAGPLKWELDRYLNCLEYDPKSAAALGFSHEEMVRTLVDDVCLRRGAGFLMRGDWLRGFRLFSLAWSLYPQVTARRPRTYALAALLALGPLGPRIAQGFKKLAL